ncbi:E3 ubiquitin-protein ligase TRIM35-like isoform X2 [Osmerus eperlanus]|uniref:E3 ubiquitin-protein ligase TRIM35-like isoform X2 n=1 Tax=Osmerus eperlanus TaxID=29151 RepID=UPI002E0F5A0E
MAGKWWGISEKDVSCPLCEDIFGDPVTLNCSHTLCELCVRKVWRNAGLRACPICKEGFWQNKPPINLSLKNICQAFLRERAGRAEQDPKEYLRLTLQASKKTLRKCNEEQLCCEESAAHVKTQALSTEKQIKAEFRKLERFLKMQKAARMAALEEELEVKTRALKDRMNGLEDKRSALTQTISCIEELLNAQDSSFNQNIEVTLQRASDLNIQSEPETNTLLNVAKHIGNLAFHVWEEMKTLVKYTPVTLDPNTPTPWLILSKDLTSVRDRITVKVPPNPERFEGPWVLGSEGFSQGSHSWDVAVPMEDWWVGVAPEAVSRYDPPGEIWAVHCNPSGDYFILHPSQDAVQLAVDMISNLRVTLDMDRGELSFFSDENAHLHTVSHAFRERMYPIFNCIDRLSVLSRALPLTLEPGTFCDHYKDCHCFEKRDLFDV